MSTPASPASAPVRISVISDVICPWCYLGKRRLESALEESGTDAEIAWLPFELNPDMPVEGMPRAEYRERKFGAERGATLDTEMRERGEAEGLNFDFERMSRTPNTRRAHMLIAHAATMGEDDSLVDALFRAYFEEGVDIGDVDALLGVAASLGFDEATCRAVLADATIAQAVANMEARATEAGVTGVPFFIVEEKYGISGAQPKETWLSVFADLNKAAEG
ncbi:MAG: DsbA family oxidoreductase [Salinarimonadaceae bacterium]|nr:MAG: DsbA family oxidoreductase [Salinarimonadaceae bacterium]